MGNCSYCGYQLTHLPFKCRRCGLYHCEYCSLPENHKCKNLHKGNIFKRLRPGEKQAELPSVEYEQDAEEINSYNVFDKHSTHRSNRPHRYNTPQSEPQSFKFGSILKFAALCLIVFLVFTHQEAVGNYVKTGFNGIGDFFNSAPASNSYTPSAAVVASSNNQVKPAEVKRCSDSTVYGKCSINTPLFCDNGKLVQKASVCGCQYDQSAQGDFCVSTFETNPKKVQLEYTLRGNSWQFDYTVYQGLSDYLSQLSRSYYCSPVCPSKTELELRVIDEEHQKPYLEPLVKAIQQQTSNKDDQARIAISLVQNIPYDDLGFRTGNLNSRYPYEVLTDQKGVCGEKAKLLAFLLRDLGFGVALFDFDAQSHQAVGIKCPVQYSLDGSGYCFIESTQPTITTDNQRDYMVVGKLSRPNILLVSDGQSFDGVGDEYADAQKLIRIDAVSEANDRVLDAYTYSEWRELVSKYGLHFSDSRFF